MALGGPKPMPQDENGQWVPEQEIARRRNLANQMWDVPTSGGGWAGALASLLSGGAHGYENAKMRQAIGGNEQFSNAAMQRALGAQGIPGVIDALAAGSPEQKKSALSLMLQEKDPARALDMRAKQRALAQAELMDPLKLKQLEEEMEAAKSKRALDDWIMRSLVPGQSGAPSPTPPTAMPPAAPRPPLSPTSITPPPGVVLEPAVAGEGVMPGGVTKTQNAPPQPQQQAPAAQPEADMVNTPYGRMTRDKARQIGGILMLRGKPDAGKALIEAAGQGSTFGKEGGSLLDKKSIDATNHIARLVDVEKSFNPEFLQIPKRLGFAWTSVRAKLQDLTPEQAKPLAQFAEFRRASVENMSRLLNELSGAAVSPQEYERIRNTQPDAGTGIFDGDDPVTFQAKMRGVVAQQKRAIARYNYLRKAGPQGANPWDVMPLEDIDKVINAKGAELHKQIKQENPKADPAVIDQAVKAKLAQEFGIQI
jgi:hypothetical protein